MPFEYRQPPPEELDQWYEEAQLNRKLELPLSELRRQLKQLEALNDAGDTNSINILKRAIAQKENS